MRSLTKAAFTCGSGSIIIVASILLNLPFAIQIILLLTGIGISIYGMYLFIKIATTPIEQTPKTSEQPASAPKKKKGPTSTL